MTIVRAEIERLIGVAKEDDAKMTRAPWTTPTGTRLLGAVNAVIDGLDRQVASACGQAPQFDGTADVGVQLGANAAGIARTRSNLPAMAAALTQLLAEVDAARAESARLQAMVDQLVTARDVALVEVERLQSLAAIGDLTVHVRDLDELCMDHVSNDDEVGADAEGRLVTAVEIRARLIEAYRASKEPR